MAQSSTKKKKNLAQFYTVVASTMWQRKEIPDSEMLLGFLKWSKHYSCKLKNKNGALHSNKARKTAKKTALLRALAGFLENNSAGWEETVSECLCAEAKGGVYKAGL